MMEPVMIRCYRLQFPSISQSRSGTTCVILSFMLLELLILLIMILELLFDLRLEAFICATLHSQNLEIQLQ